MVSHLTLASRPTRLFLIKEDYLLTGTFNTIYEWGLISLKDIKNP